MATLSDIKNRGWNALVKSLGISDAAMFVMEHERGSGNYTKARKKMFRSKTAKSIADEIKSRKK